MMPNNGVRRRLETPVKTEDAKPGFPGHDRLQFLDKDRLQYPGTPSQYIYESIDSPQVRLNWINGYFDSLFYFLNFQNFVYSF